MFRTSLCLSILSIFVMCLTQFEFTMHPFANMTNCNDDLMVKLNLKVGFPSSLKSTPSMMTFSSGFKMMAFHEDGNTAGSLLNKSS